MDKKQIAATLVAFAVLIPMTGCGPADVQGTVTARIHQGKWRYLRIRQADGETVKVRVGLFSHEWRHCHRGDSYPQCA